MIETKTMPVNLTRPFTIPRNPPADIKISCKSSHTILSIQSHHSIALVFGITSFAGAIFIIYLCITKILSNNIGFAFFLAIIALILILFGAIAIHAELVMTKDKLYIDIDNQNNLLSVYTESKKTRPLKIKRNSDIILQVDGIELTKHNPTHRLVMMLEIDKDNIYSLGTFTQEQYFWLKNLFISYFNLRIYYRNPILERMQF